MMRKLKSVFSKSKPSKKSETKINFIAIPKAPTDHEILDQTTIDFAVGVLRQIGFNGNESSCLSPISLSQALALVYSGASGDTRKEFEAVFAKGKINADTLNTLFQQTMEQLVSTNEDLVLEIANRAYADKSLNVKTEYKELIAKYFNGDFEQLDFSQVDSTVKEINEFVAKMTHNKFRNAVESSMINDQTRLIIVNAVYFKGNWDDPFEEELTTDEKFYVSAGKSHKVKMMKRHSFFIRYTENEDVKVLSLPYVNGDARFLVYLPKEKFGLEDWVNKIDGGELLKLKGQLQTKEVEIKLPRFTVNFEIEMNNVLKKLGLLNAFTELADFSGITDDPLFISESIHKALIEVNEQGTVASAYSGRACGCAGGTPPPKKIFYADHPFLYAIFYESHPLFIGTFFG
ncbi:hypothetical protein M3Y94_00976000 [Aphelenchoides besseyi]|nr:hypothetical protein M3Y94_00976000 [Aphelenchoides besseyi]